MVGAVGTGVGGARLGRGGAGLADDAALRCGVRDRGEDGDGETETALPHELQNLVAGARRAPQLEQNFFEALISYPHNLIRERWPIEIQIGYPFSFSIEGLLCGRRPAPY